LSLGRALESWLTPVIQFLKTLTIVVGLFASIQAGSLRAASITVASQTPSVEPSLSGVWLVESASWDPGRRIVRAKLTITGHNFALVGFRGIDRVWTGTFNLGTDGDPRNMDLHTDAFDVSPPGGSLLVPPLLLRCIYKLEPSPQGDRLTVCYARHSNVVRPEAFTEPAQADDNRLMTFVRPKAGFTKFPQEVVLTVLDPQGHPAAGASVFGSMQFARPFIFQDGGKTVIMDMKSPPKWTYYELQKAADDGTLRLPYTDFEKQFKAPVGVRDETHHWIGFIAASAASLQNGKYTVHLEPETLARGIATCDDLEAEGKRLSPIPTVSLECNNDEIATWIAEVGAFQFPLSPGTYRVCYSSYCTYTHYQLITVPAGTGDLVLPPIHLDASEGMALVGNPLRHCKACSPGKTAPSISPASRARSCC
jgi:hypothetical protein